MTQIDPDLVGVWLSPGSIVTYEVCADGTYHVADPEEPVHFENEGAVMIWGGRRYTRRAGAGATPEGRWVEDGSSDVWAFGPDGSYSITNGTSTFIGIWVLRNQGTALWTRELRAQLSTNGAQITFHPEAGRTLTYCYTVSEGLWSILDPLTWQEVNRYVSPAYLAQTVHATVTSEACQPRP